MTKSSIFSIAPGESFVDALAGGVLAEAGGDAYRLRDYTILLPTRRACRAVQDAFLRAVDGRATVLPILRPLGDVDEDELVLQDTAGFAALEIPPGMPALRRRLLLTQLVQQFVKDATVDQAARLAAELERFLDQVYTERLDFDGISGLAPENFAHHWQLTLEFLTIITEHWPKILAAESVVDGTVRRNMLLENLAAHWREKPPPGQIIAAGSTGSIPATADLLAVVGALPNGRVVLPGLFRNVDDEHWAEIASAETHPQFNLARLLRHLQVRPEDVKDWPGQGSDGLRERLMSEVMRPAQQTEKWRDIAGIGPSALSDIQRIECTDPAEEAGVIALILRNVLETGGKTAAVVTPDRSLARRIAAALRRWNVEIDDSGGEPLASSGVGAFLRLTAQMVAEEFAPVALLAVLKHPMAALGRPAARLRFDARLLERHVLRGPRPGSGIQGIRAAAQAALRKENLGAAEYKSVLSLLDDLENVSEDFLRAVHQQMAPFEELLELHIAFAEAIAGSDSIAGPERLWAGEAGETASAFLTQLRETAAVLGAIPGQRYEALLDTLMTGLVVRPRYGLHPRLSILGLLEARLQRADVVVLAGLNEETWPPAAPLDPWMSRPMRTAFGLPSPDRRIGLSAHDFVQAFGAKEVILTRAQKVDGQPTVPSRWLSRLDAVVQSAGLDPAAWQTTAAWRELLSASRKPVQFQSIDPPAPTPPLYARPRRLSVTQIESWMRDPYAIYARHILKLKKLDPLDANPGAADRGTFIHHALDLFVRTYPRDLPPDAMEKLLEFGKEAFGAVMEHPSVWAFWWPRFTRIAAWFLNQELARRPEIEETMTERDGKLQLIGPQGPFLLTAKADRIELRNDGYLSFVDYKTGGVPTQNDMTLGFAPQLPLEAAIAMQGLFSGVPNVPVKELAHWKLAGGAVAGAIQPVNGDPSLLAAEALQGLQNLIEVFDQPETPYAATPRPAWAMRFNDYAHLSRYLEWGQS